MPKPASNPSLRPGSVAEPMSPNVAQVEIKGFAIRGLLKYAKLELPGGIPPSWAHWPPLMPPTTTIRS